MLSAFFPSPVRPDGPALAVRLVGILLGLLASVAHHLPRTAHAGVTTSLCHYLYRTARRLTRLIEAVANGRAPKPRRRARPGRSGSKPVALPRQPAWLLRDLRHQAAVWRNQLERLLDEPEARAFLAAAPTAGRLLRPLCHMLALKPPLLYPPKSGSEPRPERAAAALPEPAPPGRALASLPCPRLAIRWPWRDLLAKNPA
jgi:hypothetical protein